MCGSAAASKKGHAEQVFGVVRDCQKPLAHILLEGTRND
jgi:hypothetical protein